MEKLIPNQSYHIFNHANGFENVFMEHENYRFFMEKYQQYISVIAETYAYCLMPNHFHLVVRIKKREQIEVAIRAKTKRASSSTNCSNASPHFPKVSLDFSKVSSNFRKVEADKTDEADIKVENNVTTKNTTTPNGVAIEGKISNEDIEKFLSKQFANLFSCYTQSFNRMYGRRGSLFIKNFKRETILDKEYFLNAIVYTHRNPIHHGFCTRYTDWSYTSYCEIVDQKSELVEANKLIKVFGSKGLLVDAHKQNLIKFNQKMELEAP